MTPLKTTSLAAVLAPILALTLSAGPALAAGDADAVAATVRQFATAINVGDFKTAGDMQTADVQITDEVPPYHWQGQGAPMAWLKDWGAFAEAKGISGQAMTWTGDPRVEIDGDRAYAVFPGVFGFKIKGAQVNETGTLGASLVRTPAGWRMSAWTWAGSAPK